MEQVTPGGGLALSIVSPASRWGVSGCPGGRTRQGADARPLTIPASGCLRATLRAVPSSFAAADGSAGLAVPGEARPFADVLSAHPGLRSFLSAADASGKPPPVVSDIFHAVRSWLMTGCYAWRRAGTEYSFARQAMGSFRLPSRHAARGAFVNRCGRRTGRPRHPWRGPSFRRRPVGSSWPPFIP